MRILSKYMNTYRSKYVITIVYCFLSHSHNGMSLAKVKSTANGRKVWKGRCAQRLMYDLQLQAWISISFFPSNFGRRWVMISRINTWTAKDKFILSVVWIFLYLQSRKSNAYYSWFAIDIRLPVIIVWIKLKSDAKNFRKNDVKSLSPYLFIYFFQLLLFANFQKMTEVFLAAELVEFLIIRGRYLRLGFQESSRCLFLVAQKWELYCS